MSGGKVRTRKNSTFDDDEGQRNGWRGEVEGKEVERMGDSRSWN